MAHAFATLHEKNGYVALGNTTPKHRVASFQGCHDSSWTNSTPPFVYIYIEKKKKNGKILFRVQKALVLPVPKWRLIDL